MRSLVFRAVVMGKASERLVAVRSGGSPIVPENISSITTALDGHVLLPPRLTGTEGEMLKAIPDGNRGAVLAGPRVVYNDREYLIGLKGIGARRPMYEDPPWTAAPSEPYPFSAESWFGENPWGAMSGRACLEDAAITRMAEGSSINGFHICPMLRAEPLPEDIMEKAMMNHCYRKLDDDGPYYQEFRLVPSNVRLYYQSSSTLGDNVVGVMEAFGVLDVGSLDMLIQNYIGSGIAALTLGARTMICKGSLFTMLDYHDVWLDKDSVIAPDGTLFFADIEGLDRTRPMDAEGAARALKTQFDRNFYEFMYGLDRMLRYREMMRDRELSWEARRAGAGVMFEMALSDDPFLELVRRNGSLVIRAAPCDGAVEVDLKLIDLGGS